MWFRSDQSRRHSRRLFLQSLEDRRLLALAPLASYLADINPQAVVAADFNNDGRLALS